MKERKICTRKRIKDDSNGAAYWFDGRNQNREDSIEIPSNGESLREGAVLFGLIRLVS